MKTAFIRHQIDKNTLNDLYKSQLIAVQYKNIQSTDPKDYTGEGKYALRKFWKYCDESVLIGATYLGLYPQKMTLGVIDEGSEIRAIEINGFWNKTVKLQNIKEIDLCDYPILLAIQPRQITTTFWPSANKILNALYSGDKLPCEVSSLAPGQLEILCYEYLRIRGYISHLLLPTGQTMRDIDIYGINRKNEPVFAQVTQSRNKEVIAQKIETLRRYYPTSTRLFFFGPEEFPTTDKTICYQPIEKVFFFMLEKCPDFIDALLGFKLTGFEP
jgi:hypothetical protein